MRRPAPSLEQRAQRLREKADHEIAYVGDVKILIDARLRDVLPAVIHGVYRDYDAHRRAHVWYRKLWRRVFPPADVTGLVETEREAPKA